MSRGLWNSERSRDRNTCLRPSPLCFPASSLPSVKSRFAEVITAQRLATMAASELSGSRSTTIGKPMNAAFGNSTAGRTPSFPPNASAAGSRRPRMRTVGDPVAEQDAPNHGSRHLPRFHTGKLVEQHHGQADPVDELVEEPDVSMGKKPIRSTTMPNRMMPNTGTSVERMDSMGASEEYCLFNQSEAASYIPCAAGMQWEKRRPHRALDIPECPCRLSHPFTVILPCFFFFPLVLLMKITQPLKKPSPHYGMDTSQQQETKTKLLIKTACSFHGAFCWRCVSRSYPPPPPLPAPTRQNTIKPSGIWAASKIQKTTPA